MSMLYNLNCRFQIDASICGSTDEEIRALLEYSKITVPEEFIDVIKERSEIEIQISSKKYLRIWGACGCIEMNDAYNIQKYIPSSLAIADDEGGSALLYANGQNGFGLYIVAFNDLEIDEMRFVSKTLSDLLVLGKGTDTVINFFQI